MTNFVVINDTVGSLNNNDPSLIVIGFNNIPNRMIE